MPSRRNVLRTTGFFSMVAVSGCTGRQNQPGFRLANNEVSSEASGTGEFPMHQFGPAHIGYVDGSVSEQSGADRWVSSVGQPVYSTGVVLGGGSVYVLCGSRRLCSLDQNDGSLQWSSSVPTEALSTPVFEDGTVMIASPSHPDDFPGGLYAFDATDGTERWRNQELDGSSRQATAYEGYFYIAGDYRNNAVSAVTASSGEVKWNVELDSPTGSVAVTSEGVFVRSRTSLHRLDLADGTSIWATPTEGYVDGYPTVKDGVVYVQATPSSFAAFDSETGERLWTFEDAGETTMSACIDGDTVYLSGRELVSLRRGDGTRRWSRDTSDVSSGSEGDGNTEFGDLVVTDDTIYSVFENSVVALTRSDGSVRWRRIIRERSDGDLVHGGFPGPPAVGGDSVFCCTSGGDVFGIAR